MGRSHGDVSRFHIDLDAAHTILPQACLRTVLRLDEHASNSGANGSPLVKYAAEQYFSFVEPEFGSPLYYMLHSVDSMTWQNQGQNVV